MYSRTAVCLSPLRSHASGRAGCERKSLCEARGLVVGRSNPIDYPRGRSVRISKQGFKFPRGLEIEDGLCCEEIELVPYAALPTRGK